MNYTELVIAIQSHLENTFPTFTTWDGVGDTPAQQIARFVHLAERRVYQQLGLPVLRHYATQTLNPGNPVLAIPVDVVTLCAVAVSLPTGDVQHLIPKDPEFIRAAYPNPTRMSIPKYYALTGSPGSTTMRCIVGPTPDNTYSVNVEYFGYPESITTAVGGHTWLGDNFDNLLLMASLLEAYTFMKGDPDMLAAYGSQYSDALNAAGRLITGLQRTDTYRTALPFSGAGM